MIKRLFTSERNFWTWKGWMKVFSKIKKFWFSHCQFVIFKSICWPRNFLKSECRTTLCMHLRNSSQSYHHWSSSEPGVYLLRSAQQRGRFLSRKGTPKVWKAVEFWFHLVLALKWELGFIITDLGLRKILCFKAHWSPVDHLQNVTQSKNPMENYVILNLFEQETWIIGIVPINRTWAPHR